MIKWIKKFKRGLHLYIIEVFILSYERYIGNENYPEIIDEELFNRVHRIIDNSLGK